jgi:hypothetical protein
MIQVYWGLHRLIGSLLTVGYYRFFSADRRCGYNGRQATVCSLSTRNETSITLSFEGSSHRLCFWISFLRPSQASSSSQSEKRRDKTSTRSTASISNAKTLRFLIPFHLSPKVQVGILTLHIIGYSQATSQTMSPFFFLKSCP